MKIALYLFLGLLVLAGLLFGFVYAKVQIPKLVIPIGASEQEKIECVDQWFSNLEEKGKFNGGVLMAKAGQSLLMKTYGYTNYTKKDHLSPQSSFRLASVSKQFTAAGVMLLREQDLLDYDDTVAQYLTDFPYEGVSIRHLLNQTSGVPDVYMSLAKKYKAEVGDTLSIAEAVQLVCQYPKPATALPGEVYAYSNTNYILLAGLVETISKQSFEAYLQEHLFAPLGMKNTRVWNLFSAESTFPNKTDGFEQYGKPKAVPPSWIDGVAGDGGVFCSLEDFLIWDQFWYANTLINPENLMEAFKKPSLVDGTKSDYGFGWGLDGDEVWHNGAWLAANTAIIRNTKTKTCLVLLDNSSNLSFGKILAELGKLK